MNKWMNNNNLWKNEWIIIIIHGWINNIMWMNEWI